MGGGFSRPQAGSPPAVTLSDLPDALIARIVALAGPTAWPALALVSRRFNSILFSPAVPEAWRAVELTSLPQVASTRHPGWLAGKQRLLRRVGGCVDSLAVLDSRGDLVPYQPWPLGQLLAALPSGVLQNLQLEVPTQQLPAALAQALPRFALRSLTLHAELPAELSAALRPLHQLTSLSLAALTLPDGTLPAVLGLPPLQALTLMSLASPLPHCDQLGALRQLRRLKLIDRGEHGEPLRVPEPAAFPHLSEFYCYSPERAAQFGASRLFFVVVSDRRTPDDEDEAAGEGWKVTLHCGSSGPLGPLLAAVLPPHLPLRQLDLADFELQLGQLECGGRLAPLHVLELSSCGWPGSIDATLAALLQQAPALRRLELRDCPVEGARPPPCLVDRKGLRALSFSNCDLAELPPGPYLRGLTKLGLDDVALTRLPPSLAQAAALRDLSLAFCEELVGADADVDWLLAACPQLRSVDLADSYGVPDEVEARLQAALAMRSQAAAGGSG